MPRDLETPPLAPLDPGLAHVERLGIRLGQLEEAIDRLIETHQTLMEALAAKKSARKRKEMPSPNTKYFDFLVYLDQNFGEEDFTSEEIPRKSRHILSILNTEYSSLEVVSKRGRTNVYRVTPKVRKRLGAKSSSE